jgi:hypothetical protein
MTDVETEDYKTRNHEIQQIVAHRFQLTTLAILVFSAVAGWLTTYLARLPSNPQEDHILAVSILLPAVSLLLILIMAVLYYEYFALLRTLRVFSAYLLVKFPSQWERDWIAYREHPLTKKYSGYSKSGFRIFLLLASLSVVYPLSFLIPYHKDIAWRWTGPLLFLIFVLLSSLLRRLYRTTYHQKKYIDEDQLEKGWRLVLSERSRAEHGGPDVKA